MNQLCLDVTGGQVRPHGMVILEPGLVSRKASGKEWGTGFRGREKCVCVCEHGTGEKWVFHYG